MSDLEQLPQSNTFPNYSRLGSGELQKLFEATDWSAIEGERSIKDVYGKYYSQSYFKALTLPYLLPLTEERPLAKELAERELLQKLCGFEASIVNQTRYTPTHNMLRHFRHSYRYIFPEIMRRLLTSMAIAAHQLHLSLPFAEIVEDVDQLPEGVCVSFRLEQEGDPFVILWISEQIENEDQNRDNIQRTDKLLVGDLRLPIEAFVQLNSPDNKQTFNVILDKPSWLQNKSAASDPITTLGSANITRPYTACNVIVVRQIEGRKEILLSQRLAGFGAGMYELPGGKLSPDDLSIEACAMRELKEETGLELITSRLVSKHETRYPGKPRVKSIGVLALEFKGTLKQHLESHQNMPWQWYELDNLPEPLFDPSKLAIKDYLENRFPDLKWSDVEKYEPRQLSFSFMTDNTFHK